LIDDRAIRYARRDLYAPIGRPSIPPEQLVLPLATSCASRASDGS